MGNDKKVESKEEAVNEPPLGEKGPILYGTLKPPLPKEYKCSQCGTILGGDILWKDNGSGVEVPYCGQCKIPVKKLK